MALNKVPAPTLDTRSGDQVAAQSIAALPNELSDRSPSNPAVAIIEASANQFDAFLYQLNNFPTAVIQKCLALVGTTLNGAQPATVTQTFTLSAPQTSDTTIPKGTLVQTTDGSIIFSTLADATIRAYTSPAGTITLSAGSTTVTGSGTAFTTAAPAGYAISTDKNTWYTVASVTNDTTLTLTSSAAANVSGAYYSGAITTTAAAQSNNTGSSQNVAAATLTSLGSSIAGVASTTNAAAATGGADQETSAAAVARAPQVFASRDTACSATDYAYFAQQILGTGGRAYAQANTNNTTATSGYTTVAMLSPSWTTSSSVSAQERANVVRDLAGRTYSGATTIDVAANIQQFTTAGVGNSTAGAMFGCALYRKAAYDSASTQVAAAGAINTYLSPNTYPWGRSIEIDDLANQLAPVSVPQIDRIASINGRLCVGMNYTVVANNVSFTNGSTSATGTASDFTNMTIGQTFLLDQTNNAIYLVTNIVSGTLTITPAYAGPTNSQKPAWLTSQTTALTNWYSLPFSSLSVSTSSPPASILVVGSV